MTKQTLCLVLAASLLACHARAQEKQEKTGSRPYEMEWAARTQDDVPPLLDFEGEGLGGWRIEAKDSVATFTRSREQLLWGQSVGKLSYRATGDSPEVRILAPAPLALPPCDTLRVWLYGNRWSYENDASTPSTQLSALLQEASGAPFEISLAWVNWKEWSMAQRRASASEQKSLRGAKLLGFVLRGGTNRDERALFLDNFAAFQDALPPLKFEPRPARPFAFAGQDQGTNSGPGKLTFPTREQTILPANLTRGFKISLAKIASTWAWMYAGSDGTLRFSYTPRDGSLGDISARWSSVKGGPKSQPIEFRPCVGGGVRLDVGGKATEPESAQLLKIERRSDGAGEFIEARWRLGAGDILQDVVYTLRLWNKSLVVDVRAADASQNRIAEIRYGSAVGLPKPRLVTLPYYTYARDAVRPAVVVSGNASSPLFVAGHTDWYRSNASELFARNEVTGASAFFNGGTRYVARTDGKRNAAADRFFIVASPRFEEVLPTLANPPSPYKSVMAPRLWTSYGASNRANDQAHWKRVRRLGLSQILITDHETMWRDGGESFTFRTRTAPGKGGDDGQRGYSKYLQRDLGFKYGPYNQFTDLAPVNAFWSTDRVTRSADGQLVPAWPRNYLAKPAAAPEFGAKLPPIIQQKYGFSAAYCDVHTAIAPWATVDYDARVPGAGTFAATFTAYGEVMQQQKRAWSGPVYSEGGYHAFYSGLTDGNYAQDHGYGLDTNPWLVDFDLRQMHALGCNFGMGNFGMFYSSPAPASEDEKLDRFLAATIAFGHTGFIETGSPERAMRMYFPIQALQSRYVLAQPTSIRYADASGQLLESSAAIASGAFRRSQIVTRYDDGTTTVVNGNPTERLRLKIDGQVLDLPPNGYAGWSKDRAVRTLSSEQNGARFDYAASPKYVYIDGRSRFARLGKAAGSGQAVCLIEPGHYEIIPLKNADCGFAIDATRAVALDEAGQVLGEAKLRRSRGLTYVAPVAGAFSYRLARAKSQKIAARSAAPSELSSARDFVVAGEAVVVRGRAAHTITIPRDALPGQRVWRQLEDRWIDFTVVPLLDLFAEPIIVGQELQISLISRAPSTCTVEAEALGQKKSLTLPPGQPRTLAFDLGAPSAQEPRLLTVSLRTEESAAFPGHSQTLSRVLRVREDSGARPLGEGFSPGITLRGKAESRDLSGTGAIVEKQGGIRAGGVARAGIFIHPPWQGASGAASASWSGVRVPSEPSALRAWVGKTDGSFPGDGILFQVAVVSADGKQTIVAQKTVAAPGWQPIEADLSRWAGQEITLKLISDVGAKDDSSGDWSAWAEPRIERLEPRLAFALDADTLPLERAAAPLPLAGLSLEEVRGAKSAWLHYEGLGFAGDAAPYVTAGTLNGVALGAMAPAGGDEQKGAWAPARLPLPPGAIRALGARNRLALDNAGRDYFALRRFWVEIELADGRRASSLVSTSAYTQPAEWPYGGGIRVPFGQPITLQMDFSFAPR